VIVGLNFAIEITVIVGFNITSSTKVGYILLLIKEIVLISVNHASLVIILQETNHF